MENLFIVFATILPALALMFLESMLRVNWVAFYYSFGIRLYNRSLVKDQKSLIDIYAEVSKFRENGPAAILYRLTDENDRIFFRNKYDNKLYKNSSLLHGVIKEENGAIGIAGYIGLTEFFYACFIPFLLGYIYLLGNYPILIPIIVLVFLGNIVYYFLNYLKTKKILDGI